MRVSGAWAYRVAIFGGCLILLGLGILTLCSCAPTTIDGAYSDTERGVCASEGQESVTSYNRHGPVTRCELPE